jgi:hypothetical protein
LSTYPICNKQISGINRMFQKLEIIKTINYSRQLP